MPTHLMRLTMMGQLSKDKGLCPSGWTMPVSISKSCINGLS